MIARDEDHTRAAYDEVADTYADHFTATEAEIGLDLAVIDHFIALLSEPRRTLDAGCGAGRMLPHLAARGCRVEGVDLSEGMVRRARPDHPGFAVQVASLARLPHPDHAFDGVFNWYSTIHSTDAELPGLLAEARRVLRPGGHLLLGFQAGQGARDVGQVYRGRGHDIVLLRYGRDPAWMVEQLVALGMVPVTVVERAATGSERDEQGFVIARRP